jgi:hypothetical protein
MSKELKARLRKDVNVTSYELIGLIGSLPSILVLLYRYLIVSNDCIIYILYCSL